jgi:hypothetical protein
VFGNGLLRQRGTKMNGQARVFETWRSNRERIALRDTSIRCFKTPLENMFTEELKSRLNE